MTSLSLSMVLQEDWFGVMNDQTGHDPIAHGFKKIT